MDVDTKQENGNADKFQVQQGTGMLDLSEKKKSRDEAL